MARKIPDGTAAVITKSGSVYHPIWTGDGGHIRGTMVHARNEKLSKEGGNYIILPATISRCLTQGEYEIWQMCQRNGLEMPPEKR